MPPPTWSVSAAALEPAAKSSEGDVMEDAAADDDAEVPWSWAPPIEVVMEALMAEKDKSDEGVTVVGGE